MKEDNRDIKKDSKHEGRGGRGTDRQQEEKVCESEVVCGSSSPLGA